MTGWLWIIQPVFFLKRHIENIMRRSRKKIRKSNQVTTKTGPKTGPKTTIWRDAASFAVGAGTASTGVWLLNKRKALPATDVRSSTLPSPDQDVNALIEKMQQLENALTESKAREGVLIEQNRQLVVDYQEWEVLVNAQLQAEWDAISAERVKFQTSNGAATEQLTAANQKIRNLKDKLRQMTEWKAEKELEISAADETAKHYGDFQMQLIAANQKVAEYAMQVKRHEQTNHKMKEQLLASDRDWSKAKEYVANMHKIYNEETDFLQKLEAKVSGGVP